jgi:hypothetical protein
MWILDELRRFLGSAAARVAGPRRIVAMHAPPPALLDEVDEVDIVDIVRRAARVVGDLIETLEDAGIQPITTNGRDVATYQFGVGILAVLEALSGDDARAGIKVVVDHFGECVGELLVDGVDGVERERRQE